MKNRSKILSPRDSQIRRDLSDTAEFAAIGFSHILSSAKSGLRKVASALSGVCASTLNVIFPSSDISIQARDSYALNSRLESISDVVKKTFPVPKPIQSDSGTMVPTPGRFELSDPISHSNKKVVFEPVEFKNPENEVKAQFGVPLWKQFENKNGPIKCSIDNSVNNLSKKEGNEEKDKERDKKDKKYKKSQKEEMEKSKEDKIGTKEDRRKNNEGKKMGEDKEDGEIDKLSKHKAKKIKEGDFFGEFRKEMRKRSPGKLREKNLEPGVKDVHSTEHKFKAPENSSSPKNSKISESVKEAYRNTPEFHSSLPEIPEKSLMLKMTPECPDTDTKLAVKEPKKELNIKPPIDFSALKSPQDEKDLINIKQSPLSDTLKQVPIHVAEHLNEEKKIENSLVSLENSEQSKKSEPTLGTPSSGKVNSISSPENPFQPLSIENKVNLEKPSSLNENAVNPFLDSNCSNIEKPKYVFGSKTSDPPAENKPQAVSNPFAPNPISTSNPFAPNPVSASNPFTPNPISSSNPFIQSSMPNPSPFTTNPIPNSSPFTSSAPISNPFTSASIQNPSPFTSNSVPNPLTPTPNSNTNPFLQQAVPSSSTTFSMPSNNQSSYSNPFTSSGFNQPSNPVPANPAYSNTATYQFPKPTSPQDNFSQRPFASNPSVPNNPFAQNSGFQSNPFAPSSYNSASNYSQGTTSNSYAQNPLETNKNLGNLSASNPFNPGNNVQNPFGSNSIAGQYMNIGQASYPQEYRPPNPFANNVVGSYGSQISQPDNPGGINPRPEFYGSSYAAPSTQPGNGSFTIGHVPTRTAIRGKRPFNSRIP